MSRVLAFKFGVSATALIVGANTAPGTYGVPTTPIGSATLSAQRTTVYVGEACHLWVVSNGMSCDARRRECLWSFDDVGSTYWRKDSGAQNSANSSFMPYTAKVWETPGSKDVTCFIWNENGEVTLGSITITVVDPDTITPFRHLYVSASGDTSGFPAQTSVIQHVTLAEFKALSFSTDGRIEFITFRDDETFNFGTAGEAFSGVGSTYLLRRTGTGTNPPKLTANDGVTILRPSRNAHGLRFIANEIDGLGTYDPQFGTGNVVTLFGGDQPLTEGVIAEITIFGCNMEGGNLGVTTGGETNNGPSWIAIINNRCRKWKDYCFARFGGRAKAASLGNDFRQDPLANIFNSTKVSTPDMSDHCHRFMGAEWTACEALTVYASGGWSGLSRDWAVNTALRIHPTDHTADHQHFVSNCDLRGAWLCLQIGDESASGFVEKKGLIQVTRTRFRTGRQTRYCVEIDVGELGFFNNWVMTPNLDNQGAGFNGGLLLDNSANLSASTGSTAQIGFNNFLSFRSDTYNDVVTDWASSIVTKTNNVVYCPNASNSGSYASVTPLSPGDDFKPTVASPANDSVSTGWRPHFDFDGNVRTATTNKGCFDTSVASSVAVAAPINSVAPSAPLELPAFGDVWYLPNHGAWNAAFDPYWIDFNWKANGVSVTDTSGNNVSFRTVLDNSGILTPANAGRFNGSTVICTLTATNNSGTKVTVNSSSRVIT